MKKKITDEFRRLETKKVTKYFDRKTKKKPKFKKIIYKEKDIHDYYYYTEK